MPPLGRDPVCESAPGTRNRGGTSGILPKLQASGDVASNLPGFRCLKSAPGGPQTPEPPIAAALFSLVLAVF